jgi:hypothetical protein
MCPRGGCLKHTPLTLMMLVCCFRNSADGRSVHGVPNQCTGDVTTVMASFNNQQEHAVLAEQFIAAFVKDDKEARLAFPAIYANSEWEIDPAPEYAREVVGRSGNQL